MGDHHHDDGPTSNHDHHDGPASNHHYDDHTTVDSNHLYDGSASNHDDYAAAHNHDLHTSAPHNHDYDDPASNHDDYAFVYYNYDHHDGYASNHHHYDDHDDNDSSAAITVGGHAATGEDHESDPRRWRGTGYRVEFDNVDNVSAGDRSNTYVDRWVIGLGGRVHSPYNKLGATVE